MASVAWYLAASESYSVLARLTMIVELVKYHIGDADGQARGNIPIVIPLDIYLLRIEHFLWSQMSIIFLGWSKKITVGRRKEASSPHICIPSETPS